MADSVSPEIEAVLEKMRNSLKRRGAEGIRGLGRHFKVSKPVARTASPANLVLAMCCTDLRLRQEWPT